MRLSLSGAQPAGRMFPAPGTASPPCARPPATTPLRDRPRHTRRRSHGGSAPAGLPRRRCVSHTLRDSREQSPCRPRRRTRPWGASRANADLAGGAASHGGGGRAPPPVWRRAGAGWLPGCRLWNTRPLGSLAKPPPLQGALARCPRLTKAPVLVSDVPGLAALGTGVSSVVTETPPPRPGVQTCAGEDPTAGVRGEIHSVV